jgi:hypothetical protein
MDGETLGDVIDTCGHLAQELHAFLSDQATDLTADQWERLRALLQEGFDLAAAGYIPSDPGETDPF